MSKYNLIQDVTKGDLLSAYVESHFDEGLEILQENGYRLISLQENARLRIQEGHQAYISQYGNWVLEDVLYYPIKGKFLTRVSHLTENSAEAKKINETGADFYLNDEQVERCLTDSVKLLSNPEDVHIEFDRFKDRFKYSWVYCTSLGF